MTAAGWVASWLLTYLVHSTLLLGGVALAVRYVVRRESLREVLWKSALAGSVATATLAAVAPWPGSPRLDVASLGAVAAPRPPADAGWPEPRLDGSPDGRDGGEKGGGSGRVERRIAGGIAGEAEADASLEAEMSVEAETAVDGPGASAGQPGERSVPGPAAAVGGSARSGWLPALVGLWAVVALALLMRLVWRHARLRWLLRRRAEVPGGHPATVMLTELRRSAGVWRPVRLTATPLVGTPMALGGAEVCVPDRFLSELREEEQRAALAHELAHLARRDPLWQVTGAVVGAVFFVQPLNRLARRGIRSAAEYMADGWAVAQTGGQLELARSLARVAGWVAPTREPVLAGTLAMAEGGSPLLGRVQRLLDRDPEPPARPAARLALSVGLVALAAAFAPAVGPAPAPAAPDVPTAREAGGGPDASGETSGSDETAGSEEADSPGPRGAPDEAEAGAPEETGPSALQAGPGQDAGAGAVQDALQVHRLDGPLQAGDGFVARLNAAGRAAGRSPYWVAYALPTVAGGREVLIDSEPWNVAGMEGPSLAGLLGVESELATSPGKVLVLARLVPEGGATRVDRVAVRRPELGMRLGGVVYWLGEVGARDSYRWLRDIYTASRDPVIRETAVDAIGMHPAAEAEPFLRRVLESGEESDIREEAVEGLATQRPDTALARLLFEVAMSDRDGGVRQEATEQLARVREPVTVGLLERLAFEAADPGVQRQAAESLGDLRMPAALAALERLVERHPSGRVRWEALDQLSQAGAGAEALLAVALGDDDPDLRREAVEQMEELPPGDAVTALRRVVFESGDGTAERQAAETLGDLGSEAAFEVLLEILERNPGEDASFQAVESIAEGFPSSVAIPALRRVLETHPSSRVRREALAQLGDLGG